MSKKIEAIAKQVFYSNQDPVSLAKTVASLITDVVTTTKVFGSATVESNATTGTTSTYTGKAYSQYGDDMADAVTLTLKQAVTGVSIAGGVVTIANTVVTGTKFTVVGTANAKTSELEVTVHIA